MIKQKKKKHNTHRQLVVSVPAVAEIGVTPVMAQGNPWRVISRVCAVWQRYAVPYSATYVEYAAPRERMKLLGVRTNRSYSLGVQASASPPSTRVRSRVCHSPASSPDLTYAPTN